MATRHTSDPVERALRLFRMLQFLTSRRPGQQLGRPELARVCECSVKTIGREIQLLKLYIPLDYDPVAKTYVLPDKGWALTTSALSLTDVLALALARSVLTDPTAPFAAQVQTTLDKITVSLPPGLREALDLASQAVRKSAGLARDYSHVPLDKLLSAAARRQTVEMLYDSRNSGACEWRLVDPYRVDPQDGRLYLQAWCHRDNRVKTFAADRIHEARITDRKFEVRAWNDSDEGVVSGWRDRPPVEVVVRFDSETAQDARRKNWPFAVEFEEEQAGSVIMRGTVQGLEGIVPVLLSWHRHVTVLGGPELRAAVIEEIRAMSAHYADLEKPAG